MSACMAHASALSLIDFMSQLMAHASCPAHSCHGNATSSWSADDEDEAILSLPQLTSLEMRVSALWQHQIQGRLEGCHVISAAKHLMYGLESMSRLKVSRFAGRKGEESRAVAHPSLLMDGLGSFKALVSAAGQKIITQDVVYDGQP